MYLLKYIGCLVILITRFWGFFFKYLPFDFFLCACVMMWNHELLL